MQNRNPADTQPSHPKASQTRPTRVAPKKTNQKNSIRWIWLFLAVLLLGITTVIGGLAGFQSGDQARQDQETAQIGNSLQEQYELGLQDLESGEYELARQRFEYILNQDPNFPGVAEKLAQAMQILYATATPTPLPPTATPSPTPDMRPIEDLFTQARALTTNEDWNGVIDTLTNLRKVDRAYRVAEVDGMLYLALRSRGIHKILNESNLEGGIYDLALAEQFGPLDVEADAARNWARIYIIGSAFWEAIPEQAVYYFGQVASAAPYLRDASGWTARERYRGALVQYGDQLASRGEGCDALEQYERAQSIRAEESVHPKLAAAYELCYPPTPTPLPETETPTITPTETVALPTPTLEPPPTEALPPTDTSTPEVDPIPLPSDTPELPIETPATVTPESNAEASEPETPTPPQDPEPPTAEATSAE